MAAWEQIRERTGKVLDGLIPPDLPSELNYLWSIYCDIFKGIEDKITWDSLAHYQSVTGSRLTPFEASLMLDIDLVRRKHG